MSSISVKEIVKLCNYTSKCPKWFDGGNCEEIKPTDISIGLPFIIMN